MTQQYFSQRQPVSSLPLLATMIDGMLENAQENQLDLKAARFHPHLLNDLTVNRAIRTCNDLMEDLRRYEEPIVSWRKEDLNPDQRHEVERLASQIRRLRETLGAILSLARELKSNTIEQRLAPGDVDAAFDLHSYRRTYS